MARYGWCRTRAEVPVCLIRAYGTAQRVLKAVCKPPAVAVQAQAQSMSTVDHQGMAERRPSGQDERSEEGDRLNAFPRNKAVGRPLHPCAFGALWRASSTHMANCKALLRHFPHENAPQPPCSRVREARL